MKKVNPNRMSLGREYFSRVCSVCIYIHGLPIDVDVSHMAFYIATYQMAARSNKVAHLNAEAMHVPGRECNVPGAALMFQIVIWPGHLKEMY